LLDKQQPFHHRATLQIMCLWKVAGPTAACVGIDRDARLPA
jgi:hypothetical protein